MSNPDGPAFRQGVTWAALMMRDLAANAGHMPLGPCCQHSVGITLNAVAAELVAGRGDREIEARGLAYLREHGSFGDLPGGADG